MKIFIPFVTTLVACAIYTDAYSQNNRKSTEKIQKRQATNADQMVQNILQWLQTVYAQNSRRIRQGTLREYLPPANTEKPRPFQPGYPAAGYSPEPPFPFPTNPATGGVTAPEGYKPEGDNEILLPPEQGSGGGENGYAKPEPQPGFTLPIGGPSGGPTTSYPTPPETEPPSIKPGFPEEQPVVFTGQPGIPTSQPDYTTAIPTLPSGQRGPFPTHPTLQPEQPGENGHVETTPGTLHTSPNGEHPGYSTIIPTEGITTSHPPYTSPTANQPPLEGTTGYPAAGQPQPTPDFPTRQPGSEQPSITLQPEGQPGVSTLIPVGPASTLPAAGGFPSETPSSTEPTEQPKVPKPTGSETVPFEEPAAIGPGEIGPVSTLAPSGFTASTPSLPEGAESEGSGTTLSPEVNTIPGPGKPEPVVDEEDLKHPPHIHAIDVQCSKEMMTINIEFNREFNGVIYSKGFYNNPECMYVQENSGQPKYSFTVNLAMCGTEFINAFDTQNQSYLENILVLQNEPGIQEVWDTVRSVRCLWEGNIKDTLSVAFSIGMLSQEIVTFSGDTAMAKLDVVLGRGPFGEPANGLVKIGEQMTLVVSVSGDPGFDLQVKDCKAVDSEGKNSVTLTDEDGCILKPKLFGAFQKTKETGNTGASIIAYAYFNAFKFPDEMDLMIECNIELCKTDCDICSKENQLLEPAKRRRKRDISFNTTLGDGLTMGKHLRVIFPEDLNGKTASEITTRDNICMSVQSFVFSTALIVSVAVVTSFISICLWLKRKERNYQKY